ncbi:MAG: hypothetical protein H7Z75_00735 [Ferruginibacter sp.]|nr:hypothetical protein [Cytophagales bacterium]
MKNPLVCLITFGALISLPLLHPVHAQMSAQPEEPLTEPVAISRVGRTDREALRVIFLAGSDYDRFRIGMENVSKSAVNIEVNDKMGAVVFNKRLRRVSRRVKEMDFSFLERGEYVVRVFNHDNAFSKVLRIP